MRKSAPFNTLCQILILKDLLTKRIEKVLKEEQAYYLIPD